MRTQYGSDSALPPPCNRANAWQAAAGPASPYVCTVMPIRAARVAACEASRAASIGPSPTKRRAKSLVAFARVMRPPLLTSGKFTPGAVVTALGVAFTGMGSVYGLPYGTKVCTHRESHRQTPDQSPGKP